MRETVYEEGEELKTETCPCPKCGQEALLYDYNEVDIGVGMERFNESWMCPDCGEFTFAFAQSGPQDVIFRDDVLKEGKYHG